jgi:hypothetical protein
MVRVLLLARLVSRISYHAHIHLTVNFASPAYYFAFTYFINSVGYGDICPGDLTTTGRIFLVCFSLGSLGTFCGPFMELTSSWKDKVPGGTATLASLALGMGTTIFTMLEGLPQSEAVYASIVTGKTHGRMHKRRMILDKSFAR